MKTHSIGKTRLKNQNIIDEIIAQKQLLDMLTKLIKPILSFFFLTLIVSCTENKPSKDEVRFIRDAFAAEYPTQEEFSQPLERFKKFVIKYPDYSLTDSIIMSLSWHYEKTEDYHEALRYYDLIKSEYDNISWQILGASLHWSTGDLSVAIKSYQDIGLCQSSQHERREIGDALINLTWQIEDYDASDQHISRFEAGLGTESTFLWRAYILIGRKKFQAAQFLLKKEFSLQERISNPFISIPMGMSLSGAGKLDSAKFFLESGLSKTPSDPYGSLALAQILVQENEVEKACDYLSKADTSSAVRLKSEFRTLIDRYCQK